MLVSTYAQARGGEKCRTRNLAQFATSGCPAFPGPFPPASAFSAGQASNGHRRSVPRGICKRPTLLMLCCTQQTQARFYLSCSVQYIRPGFQLGGRSSAVGITVVSPEPAFYPGSAQKPVLYPVGALFVLFVLVHHASSRASRAQIALPTRPSVFPSAGLVNTPRDSHLVVTRWHDGPERRGHRR